MNLKHVSLTPTVPLTLAAYTQAEQFSRYQISSRKAKQVYLNTLAVYATRFFLLNQGFETDCSQSESWNLAVQSSKDVADLRVKNVGKLECRPVLPSSKWVNVPAEVWSERIGYVAVQLHQSRREATLLGYVPQIQTEKLPLTWLYPITTLSEYLTHQQSAPSKPVQLSQWLVHQFEAEWQELAEFYQQPFSLFVNAQPPQITDENSVARAKLFTVGCDQDENQVVLVVAIAPTAPEKIIEVNIQPADDCHQLPQYLQVKILDAEAATVMQAQAETTKSMRLKFSGEIGEPFSIKLTLNGISTSEAFVI